MLWFLPSQGIYFWQAQVYCYNLCLYIGYLVSYNWGEIFPVTLREHILLAGKKNT